MGGVTGYSLGDLMLLMDLYFVPDEDRVGTYHKVHMLVEVAKKVWNKPKDGK